MDLDVGQAVWGGLGGLAGTTGAAAEYAVARRSWLSAAPKEVPLLEAAALPMTGLTGMQLIRDSFKIRPGQRLLVIGASGGVGSAAVQLAASIGAQVATLSSAANMEYCRALGAREVFDYSAITPDELQSCFDAILDCHGVGLNAYSRLLKRGGRMATVSMRGIEDALLSMLLPGPRMGVHMTRPNSVDLAALARLVDENQVRPQIEHIYPLAAMATAHRDAESGMREARR